MRTAAECFKILRDIRDTSMATIGEDGLPRLRIIDTMLVESDDEGDRLYFLTARGKDFYRELMENRYVAITGLNDRWETVRVRGKVANAGQELLEKIFIENPSMNNVYPGDTRDIMVMKDGIVVEEGKTQDVITGPSDEYTRKLLDSIIDVNCVNASHTGL